MTRYTTNGMLTAQRHAKKCAKTTHFYEIKLVSLLKHNESWFHGTAVVVLASAVTGPHAAAGTVATTVVSSS